MQIFGIVGVHNVTVTMFKDMEDEDAIFNAAMNDDGTSDKGRAVRIEQARHKRRLAAQGAEQTKFFPVNEAFPVNH